MNLTLTLTLTWLSISAEYENQVKSAISQAEISGFRKGKAPRDLVEPKLDKQTLYSRCIEALLPKAYANEIKAKNLKPILYPKIKIIKGEVGEDWQLEAITCETPKVTLGDYLAKIKEVKTDKPEDRLSAVLKVLQDTSKVDLPPILIEEEISHRLANLTDNLTKLGMTTESYLAAKKTTADGLKQTISQEASQDLTMHFIIQEAGGLDYLKTL